MTVEAGAGWIMHHADCFDVMPNLGHVDHVISDPPFETEAHTKARRSLVDSTQRTGTPNTGKIRRIDVALEINFGPITTAERIAAADAFATLASRWTVVFCQIEAIAAWRAAFVGAHLDWIRGGIWRKPDGAPQFTGDRPGQGFESLAIAHRRGRKRWNGGGKHAVWTHSLEHGHGNGTRNEHPTQKPIALMLELVTDFTDPDETILDPFAGSGTTGVAALRAGRRFVGVERDRNYFDLACERLRAEASGNTLAGARAGQLPLIEGKK